MATYGGQNIGARRLERLGEGMKAAVFMGTAYALLALVILSRFGDSIALLFLDADQTEILGQVKQYLLTNAVFYIPLVLVNVVRFMIQGMGYSKRAVLAGVCEMAARAGVGFLLVPYFGYTAVCFASPFAWIAADLFLVPSYLLIIRRLWKEQGMEAPTKERRNAGEIIINRWKGFRYGH